jgi:hypothetical protein
MSKPLGDGHIDELIQRNPLSGGKLLRTVTNRGQQPQWKLAQSHLS